MALLTALLIGAPPAAAHPVPGSTVLLDLHATSVTAELRLPVQELTAASGVDPRDAAAVRGYLRAHLRPTTIGGRPWRVRIGAPRSAGGEQPGTGPFPVLVVTAGLTPPPGADVRHFHLGYDAIVHQVVTHLAVVSVRDAGTTTTAGIIATDNATMRVRPLTLRAGGPGAGRAMGLAARAARSVTPA
ncbi:hypothetical protein [Actinoplanes sp. NPDC051494]|uniref:hypothetical protein n=1 Tax=Actinoplanes sp. NPDC051494 TaxID=3363907 RepID=UPI0037B2426F